jgi:threonylcarbamoyladenosine tRNA methylthiotransferase MtaB
LLEGFRSDELNNVLKNAYEISQQNKEIVLTGVNIGDYGKEFGKKTQHTFLS